MQNALGSAYKMRTGNARTAKENFSIQNVSQELEGLGACTFDSARAPADETRERTCGYAS